MIRDLRTFVTAIDRVGELRRITVPVSPRLEITEIVQRVVREEGPALLFENVEGSDFPLLINTFGSRKRIELALGRPPAEIGESLVSLAKEMNPPSIAKVWKRLPDLMRVRGMKPRRRNGGPVREVTEAPRLDRMPVLTCWPDDGGPFFTFPLVFTRSPRDGGTNVGIYRMQLFDAASTGMHFQIGKGGGYHLFEAAEQGKPLEVAVAFGGDPLLMLAAMMPLPEGLSEVAFVGLLRGRGVELSRGITVDLDVPAEAEFVLEGTVDAEDKRREGPFGDHFGHYSAADDYPVFRVKKVSRRKDALYPAIVVGKPPQEDGFMGNLVQELMGPLIKLPHPEIRDVWAFEETGFHHLLVASCEQRFAKEAMRSAFGLLGQGQLGLTKVVVMVGRDSNPRSMDEVLESLARWFDPEEDFLLLPKVPFDTLDFTSFTPNLGSKMVLDATPKAGGAAPPEGTPEVPDLTTVDRRITGQVLLGRSLLAVTVTEAPREALVAALAALESAGTGPLPRIVAAVSPDIPLDDRTLTLWGIFTRFDPARDVWFQHSELHGAWAVHRGRMAIDATWKPGYQEPLEMDPEIVKRVDARWGEYGLARP